jgi:TRAP-type C4-dicarboxylate transport system permease small subunit
VKARRHSPSDGMIPAIIDRLSKAGGIAAAGILGAMTMAVLYDVAMRDLFNAPTLWTVEYTSYGMAWLGLLGASDVLRREEHVGIRVLTDRLPAGMRLQFFRLASLIVLATAAYLVYAGALWVLDGYRLGEVSDTVLQTPQFIVRLAFPVGMLMVALVAALRVVAGGAAVKAAP